MFDRVQPYISSEDGKLFELTFNTDDVSFGIIELTHQEITALLTDIEEQVALLEKIYREVKE